MTVQNISLGENKRIHSWILSLTHLRNTGAALELIRRKDDILYVITVIVSVVIIYLLIKNYKSIWYSVGLSFVLAGAIGNFIDRVRLGLRSGHAPNGFYEFSYFNVADSMLVVGVICIFIYLILDEKQQRKAKMEQINVTIQTEKGRIDKVL